MSSSKEESHLMLMGHCAGHRLPRIARSPALKELAV